MTKPKTDQPLAALDAEAAALAIVLDGRHQDAWAILAEKIPSPLDWFAQAHQVISIALADLSAAGAAINALAVAGWLESHAWGEVYDRIQACDTEAATDRRSPKRRPLEDGAPSYEDSALAAIGGHPRIGEIAGTFAHRDTLPALADRIAAHSVQRRALRLAQRLSDSLQLPSGARLAPKVIAEHIDALSAILAPTGGATSLQDGIDAALQRHDRLADKTAIVRSARWGIASLDDAAPLDPGTVWTLAAAPGAGKTSLMLHAVEATARSLGPGSVLVVSREMGAQELASVVISRALRIPRRNLDRGWLAVGQREQAEVVRAEAAAWNVAIHDAQECTSADVVRWATLRHRVTSGAVGLLVIDHIGILSPEYRNQKDYETISRATARMKSLARTLGIAVLMLCQMNRDGRKAERHHGQVQADPEPQLSDLRGSGTIEQDSDGVLFLYRPTPEITEPRQIVAKVAKHRAGPQARASLLFRAADGQRFEDLRSEEPDHQTRWERLAATPGENEGAL